jgi:transglutaminase-like putative cysteine protease
MNYRVTHTTIYYYSKPVSLSHNIVHLTPRSDDRQTCVHRELEITPAPVLVKDEVDYFGNATTYFTLEEPHDQLTVRATSLVEVRPAATPRARAQALTVPDGTPAWESVRDQLSLDRSPRGLDACQFAFDSSYIKASAELISYALPSFPEGRPILEAALDLTHRIYQDFRYDPTATTLGTPLMEVMTLRRGVCQDFAHLQIACLRSLGLAARYVSGYLHTVPAPGRPRLVGADASHAWPSVYCLGSGWIDVDPTNDVIPAEHHIVLAWGRDYDDVSPIKGVNLGGGRHSVSVGVDVALVGAKEEAACS